MTSRRLIAWYAGALAAGVVLLLVGGYVLLAANLARRDADMLRLRSHELEAAWLSGGRSCLDRAIAVKPGSARLPVSIARVFGPKGQSRYGGSPDDLEDVDLKTFARLPPNGVVREVTVTEDGAPVRLELIATSLPSGDKLVVGFVPRRHEFLARTRGAMWGALFPLLALAAAAGVLLVQRAFIAETRAALDVIAHDLRTPLTRLSVEAERALAESADAAGLRDALVTCAEESGRIQTELDALLDLSEADAGGLALDMRRVDAARAAEEAADLYRDLAEDRGLTLKVTANPGLAIRADARRLRQALANLLDNAVKYTPAGGSVQLAVARMGRHVLFSVHDTGPGISAEDMPHIFDRGYRGRSVGDTPGLGLGLSLVRALVRAQGGNTAASSLPGEGSTLTIRLPALKS